MACKALLYSKFLWLISTFIFWCSCNFLWCIFYNLVIHVQYHTMCALTVLRCTCTYINWRMRTHNASSCTSCFLYSGPRTFTSNNNFWLFTRTTLPSWIKRHSRYLLSITIKLVKKFGSWKQFWNVIIFTQSAQKGATEISNHEQIGCNDGRVCPKCWQWLGSRGMAGTRVWWWDSHLT